MTNDEMDNVFGPMDVTKEYFPMFVQQVFPDKKGVGWDVLSNPKKGLIGGLGVIQNKTKKNTNNSVEEWRLTITGILH